MKRYAPKMTLVGILFVFLFSIVGAIIQPQAAYATPASDVTDYNALVGAKKFCGIQGSGEYATREGFKNALGTKPVGIQQLLNPITTKISGGERWAGNKLAVGYTSAKDRSGVVACTTVLSRVMGIVVKRAGINKKPANVDQAINWLVLYLEEGGSKAAEILKNDSQSDDDPFFSKATADISGDAWSSFVSNYLDKDIAAYKSKLSSVSKASRTAMVLPALNYCFDWGDSSSGAKISYADKKIYGVVPPAGYNNARLFKVIPDAQWKNGDAGQVTIGEENARLNNLNLTFKDSPQYIENERWYPFGYASEHLFSGVSSGMELDGDGRHLGGLLSCPQLASNASVFAGNLKLVGDKTVTLTDEAKKEAGEAGVDTDVIDGNGADVAAEADEPTCETRAKSPLTWAICPIVNGLADLTDWLFNSFILPLLETAPLSTSPNSSIFKVWSGFRLIANIVLVIVFIVMIFGQAIGGGLIDAYTVKKVLPRVLIGAIGINLSIYLSAIFIDLTNVVGKGIGTLITAPFQSAGGGQGGQGYNPGALSGVIGFVLIILAAGATVFTARRLSRAKKNGNLNFKNIRSSAYGQWLGSAISWILLFIGIPVAIAAISIFVTLILRSGVILICAVTSPIAIALWILPNTEQYFKKWMNLFVKALMVYPIIVILFAVGDVLAFAFGGDLLSPNARFGLNGVVAIFAQFIPLFMIGYAFKIAGGILGGVQEAISKRGKQAGEFIKGDARDPNSLQAGVKNRLRSNTDQARERVVNAGKDSDSRSRRTLARMANWGNLQARRSATNKSRSETMQAQIATGDDSNIRDLFIAQDEKTGQWYRRMDMERGTDGKLVGRAGASAVYKNAEAGKIAKGKAMSLYGGDKSAFQDAMYYEWKKTSFDPGQMTALEDQYGEVLAEHGFTDKEGTEAMKAVGFRHQNQSLASKYRSYKNGEWVTDHVGMAKEAALNRGSYPMSQQDVRTFDQMGEGYKSMTDTVTSVVEQVAAQTGRSRESVEADLQAGKLNDVVIGGDGQYKDKTVYDLQQARGRIASIADELMPKSQTAATGQTIPRGEDEGGNPVMSGYGGITGAPVEVRAAAEKLHATVFGRPTAPSPEPTRPAGAPVGLGDDDPNDDHPLPGS